MIRASNAGCTFLRYVLSCPLLRAFFLSIRQPHLFWRILHIFFVTCNIWFSFSFLQFFRSVFASLLWFVVCVVLRVCLGAMRHVVDTTASKKPLGKCAFFFSFAIYRGGRIARANAHRTQAQKTHTHTYRSRKQQSNEPRRTIRIRECQSHSQHTEAHTATATTDPQTLSISFY